MSEEKSKLEQGEEAYSIRSREVREVCERMDASKLWDTVQAKDLDPMLIEFVEQQLKKGLEPGEICRQMGFRGAGSKQWKKILAHFRQGFRGEAEVYLWQQTRKLYKVIEQGKSVLEDAFENGTPQVVTRTFKDRDGSTSQETEVIRVKGATKELGAFLEAYARSIALPVRLWKDYGAIGDRRDGGPAGVTILVQNNIPMPSVQDIEAHQQELKARAKAITIKRGEVLPPSPEEKNEPES